MNKKLVDRLTDALNSRTSKLNMHRESYIAGYLLQALTMAENGTTVKQLLKTMTANLESINKDTQESA